MGQRISRRQAADAARAINAALRKGFSLHGAPSAVSHAADRLGIDRRTLHNRVVSAAKHFDIFIEGFNYGEALADNPPASFRLRGGSAAPEDPPENPPEAADEKPAEDLSQRERQKYQDQLAWLRRELRDAHRVINSGELLREQLFNLSRVESEPPTWALDKKLPKDVIGLPVLFTSDFQWGEVVKPALTNGINEYNTEIAAARYKRLIERTIKICDRYGANQKYPGIVYLRGGDSISGDIHEELKISNEITSVNQIIEVVNHEIWGIKTLADRFGAVWVISVPGNHGRTTQKPMAKLYTDTNYDYIIAYMIEKFFENDKRIKFYTPLGGDAYFTIYGWPFLLTHGDQLGVKGGDGFIGPIGPITRGVKKLRQQYAQMGVYIHWVLMGHYHVPMEVEHGFVNGTTVGWSEYARSLRIEPGPPSQWLFFIDPEVGVAARHNVYLENMRPPVNQLGVITFGETPRGA